jgi:predicted nucleic-acid-binding protein
MQALSGRFGDVMLAVDTNVLVRYLTGDDPAQARRARLLIENGQVFVGATVLLETEWVLRSVYGLSTPQIVTTLLAFAGLPNVILEDASHVALALGWAADGMDFADALHVARASACKAFVTFDERCVKAARKQKVSVRQL